MRKEIDYMEMAVMNTAGAEQEICISILKTLGQKRKLNKIRIAVLKTITAIAWFLFLISACALDNADITAPATIMIACMAWLALITYANY